MTTDAKLRAILDVVQTDVCRRGLAANLFAHCAADFAAACRSLAEHPSPVVEVVTGFWIPRARLGETDGPLGAAYLARTLGALGMRVSIVCDPFCSAAIDAVVTEPTRRTGGPCTHRIALERVGPSHTPASIRATHDDATLATFLREVPAERHDRCHTMRGIDITENMGDVAGLFEATDAVTIGIGDGGNEIGMGKIPWPLVRQDVPNGATIACRIATDFLIVAGVSNWGAYALASGVAVARGVRPPADWYDLDREHGILKAMVAAGPLVDGVSGQVIDQVDGLGFAEYGDPLRRLGQIARG